MTVRWVALLTMVMSIPLFVSYQIKHVLFAPGYFFVVMYTWGLVAVLLVPALFVAELGILAFAMRQHVARSAVRLHVAAACVAIVAESIFLYVRFYA